MARSKQSGEQCKRAPIVGGMVCSMHGGKAPRVRAEAERRERQATLHAAAVTYGLPVEVSPTQALVDEIQWTAGHVAWLRERIQELKQQELTWGRTEYREGAGEKGQEWKSVERAGANVLLDLYERERKHLVAVMTAALSAGIEERRVRLAQEQGRLVADALRGALTDLGHDLTDPGVLRIVSTRLRALAGGDA
ncbi:hypothetical protein [Geodermatophilus ruber]|uniref:hypothetical protein n=1 Tax=Geodermatophilus ruber TaxID=504800 RepID=UPI000B84005A|nr:hypothetical protein [Geodermatophilus ruber]